VSFKKVLDDAIATIQGVVDRAAREDHD
jgi:hypothetical protein